MTKRGACSVKSWTSGMGYSVGQAALCRVGWNICRVYMGVYPLFKTAIHDRPGRWPTATTFAKSAEIIVSPQRVFIRPMPAHRLTLISTFWLPPPFSLRASLRAFPPTVFSPPTVFQRARGSGTRCFVRGTDLFWGKKKKKKKRNWFWIFKLYHTQRWWFPSVKRDSYRVFFLRGERKEVV